MAVINPSTDRNSINGAVILNYALANADTGSAFTLPIAVDITAQAVGTFGGATVLVEGSNDAINWNTLGANVGTNLSFTTAGLRKAAENPAYIRASTSGGTGTAVNVVIALHARFSKVGY